MRPRLQTSLLLILILGIVLPAPASAQRRGRWRPPRARIVERYAPPAPRIGATIGIDVAQMHFSDAFGGDDSNSRTGPRAGILYSIGMEGRMPVRFETGILYERKGGEMGGGIPSGIRDVLDEDYLTFPALLEIPLAITPTRPFLKVGPELSVLLSSKVRTETFDDRGFLIDSVEFDPGLHSLDVGLRFGGGIEFPLGYRAVGAIEGAYVFGLPNLSDRVICSPEIPFCGWPEMRNRAFLLSFSIYGLLE